MITRCWSFFALFIILLMSGGCSKHEAEPVVIDSITTGGGVCSLLCDPVEVSQAFVSEWKVDAGDTIFLPLLEKTADMEDRDKPYPHTITLPAGVKRVNYKYDFTVDWGDGSTSKITAFDDPDNKHTYQKAGTYTVQITGVMEAMRGHLHDDEIDISNKMIAVSDLGDVGWKALFYTFSESFNLNAVAGGDTSEVEVMAGVFYEATLLKPDISSWDTSKVVSMTELFSRAYSANPDVSKWDTSNVTDMAGMFRNAISADPDVSRWNTTSVTDMSSMFATAISANPDVSKWDTANVTDMSGMFMLSESANPDVSKWDTANVTHMSGMFMYASSANPDVSKWNTANVTDMWGMFGYAISADPDVSKWNTSKINYMSRMFEGAVSANPDVSKWDIANVTHMSGMFKQAKKAQPDMSNWSFAKVESMDEMFAGHTLNPANYANFLQRLRATATTTEKITLDAGKSDTDNSDAIAAKAYLTGAAPQGKGWVIHDNDNLAPSIWEIKMDVLIRESSEGVFGVTVKVEDAWGNTPVGNVKVAVALDGGDFLQGTTSIDTNSGIAVFSNLRPKLPASISLSAPVKIPWKLEVSATLPDDSRINSTAAVLLTFK